MSHIEAIFKRKGLPLTSLDPLSWLSGLSRLCDSVGKGRSTEMNITNDSDSAALPVTFGMGVFFAVAILGVGTYCQKACSISI